MPTRQRDIQSAVKVVSSKASKINLGGQVPSGMKRWVTFLSLDAIEPTGARSCKLYIASVGISNPTRVSCIATGNRKWMLDLRATAKVAKLGWIHPFGGGPLTIPLQPSDEAPLFTIASGKWIGLYCSMATANLFMQYFDE